MTQGFKTIWETLNAGTNLLAAALIFAGAGVVLKGHPAEGSALMTGGFAMLNSHRQSSQPPGEQK